MPNQPDAANPARLFWLTIEDQWRRVADLGRWCVTSAPLFCGTKEQKQQRKTVKTKYAVGVAMIGLALAATLFATEKQADNSTSKIIVLKSGREIVAEFKVIKSTKCHIQTEKGQKLTIDGLAKNMTVTGSFTIQFDPSGASITAKADEIEVRTEP